MKQSTFTHPAPALLHVAIIMDGSGRWAENRGLPRQAGHQEGLTAVRRVVRAARRARIGTLTLFAFSAENWRRPPCEVANLMRIFEDYFASEKQVWVEQGVHLSVIGRRDRIPPLLLKAVRDAQAATARQGAMHLRIALDFSGRDAILRAAGRLQGEGRPTPEAFTRILGEATHDGELSPEVDLIIRTGGERRLSDFLLWESAYAELYFTDCMWPDFDEPDLEAALRDYRGRERRFGRVPAAVTG